MAITPTNLGTSSSSGVATTTLTVPVGGIPAGAVIILGISEYVPATSSTHGTVTDTAGNTYSVVAQEMSSGSGFMGQIHACENCFTLAAGDTITYTLADSTQPAYLSALYATGAATNGANDAAVTAHTHGSSSTPSITSGTSAHANELFVAFMWYGSASITATQDSSGLWADTSILTHEIIGGTLTKASPGTQAYSPTFSSAKNYVIAVVGYSDVGFNTNTSSMLTLF